MLGPQDCRRRKQQSWKCRARGLSERKQLVVNGEGDGAVSSSKVRTKSKKKALEHLGFIIFHFTVSAKIRLRRIRS